MAEEEQQPQQQQEKQKFDIVASELFQLGYILKDYYVGPWWELPLCSDVRMMLCLGGEGIPVSSRKE